MAIAKIKDYLSNLTSHITFTYKGKPCGIDPLSIDNYVIWYGEEGTTVNSVEEALSVRLFDGKSLTTIINEITELEF